jgi:hypothetical protein
MNEEFVLNLYNYLSQPDVDVNGNFASGITSDDFAIEIQNPQYAAQIYNYLGTLDNEYKLKISIDDFLVSTGAVSPSVRKYGISFGSWWFGIIRTR